MKKKNKGKTKSIDGKAVNMDNNPHGWALSILPIWISEMLWASDAFVSPIFPLRNKNIYRSYPVPDPPLYLGGGADGWEETREMSELRSYAEGMTFKEPHLHLDLP